MFLLLEKGKMTMNPGVVTFLGLVVATSILLWAGIEIGKRYRRVRKKTIKRAVMDEWVPLRPVVPGSLDEDDEDLDDLSSIDPQLRVRRNSYASDNKAMLN